MQKLLVGAVLVGISFVIGFWITADSHKQDMTSDNVIKKSVECASHADQNGDMIWIEGGSFAMGSSDFYPDEGPIQNVQVEGFWIDKYEVTNDQFAQFVDETGYKTVAERQLNPADYPDIPAEQLKPGSVVFIMPTKLTQGGSLTDWWQFVPGANWREPNGPGSDIKGKDNNPVIHVAFEDARAYAAWLGRELPTEAQWEYAARGGLEGQAFAWGMEFRPDDRWRANTWQGIFPAFNEGEDGHLATSPTGCYAPNDYGIYDMIGNVWEWVDDWYYPGHQQANADSTASGYDPRQPGVAVKVIKGGSYLCAKNFCMRYRPSARHAQESNLSAAHIGFRTVTKKRES